MQPSSSRNWHPALIWALTLAGLCLVSLAARPLLPIDETRYVSVAWEMWLRGDFLVPYKNGETYSHKPPLLFWLIHAGWAAFGVNDWWPRLLSPLLSFANLWLTWRIALRLWPGEPRLAPTASIVLLASLIWAVYSQGLMFDILLASCALLSLLALVELALGGDRRWWLVYGLGIGLGLLAKGPAILLHTLPAALLAPWWRQAALPWRRWYGGVSLGVLLGIGLVLAWAIPAAVSGGEAYRNAIFWGQTADRMVESFAHQRPFWWYLLAMPLLFFPWLFWPTLVWRALKTLRAHLADPGVRLALVWLGTAFLAFSAISGKQPHYLLPEAPALALLLGFAIVRAGPLGRPVLPALALLAAGLVLLFPQGLVKDPADLDIARALSPWAGAGLVTLGALLILPGVLARVSPIHKLAAATLLALAWLLLWVIQPIRPIYDIQPLARHIAQYQARGHQVANAAKYHAQYQFLGRLTRPLAVVVGPAELAAWLRADPRHLAVIYLERGDDLAPYQALFAQPYRGGQVALVDGRALPALATR
jgi:4-amino-4-deoxy-L-arabinose transferase-like glycosyltransferase